MQQEAAPAILEVSNIEVIYNKTVQVLRGLSLSVPRGQVVALLGSNGAGKSTTLKAISRLLEIEDGAVTGGAILFNGRDIAQLAPHNLVRSGLFHVMEGRLSTILISTRRAGWSTLYCPQADGRRRRRYLSCWVIDGWACAPIRL